MSPSRAPHTSTSTSPLLPRRAAGLVAAALALAVALSVLVAGSAAADPIRRTPERVRATLDGERVEISAISYTREEWRDSSEESSEEAPAAPEIPAPSPAAEAGVRDVEPDADVVVPVGQLTQKLLDSHPEGTTFGIAAGVHRLTQPLRPRSGQELVGFPGAVLSGAKVLSGWKAAGARWYVSGQSQRLASLAGPSYDVDLCRPEAPLCNHGEDVFVDGVALRQVATLDEVTDGTYFFDYQADRIYVGGDPAGRTVETTVAPQAIHGGGRDVVVRNLVIEKFGNQAQLGAVHDGWQPGWLVEHNEIRLNHGVGVQQYGGVLRGNRIHHNGQLGIGGGGTGLVVEGNEIAHNNTQGYNPYWEAGGTKWAFAKKLTIRNNWSHHNGGQGLWTDIDNSEVLYEGNLVEDNDMAGIMHEISYSATIRDNVARRNGNRVNWGPEGAGILVYNSRDVEVSGNTVSDNAAGVAVRNDHRAPYETRNVSVTGNDIRLSKGATGLFDTTATKDLAKTNAITFADNTYTVPDLSGPWFAWGRDVYGTFAQWQGVGQDTAGALAAAPAVTPETPDKGVAAPGPDADPEPTAVADSWDAPDGSAWSSSVWARTNGLAGSVRDVQDGQGRMTSGAVAPYSWSLAEPVGGVRADGEMVVTMTRQDGASEAYVDLWQRTDDGGGNPTNGYKVEAAWDGTRARLFLYRVDGGSATWLGTLRAAPSVGEPVTVRFRTSGSTIAAKAWPAGTAEPPAWDVEVDDTTHEQGTRRIRVMSGAKPHDVDVRFDDFRDQPL